MPDPLTQAWYDQVDEDVVDETQRIIDPHHHLWPEGGAIPYGIRDLKADVASGHRVTHTMFVECGASYLDSGPEHLRSLGETQFIARTAADDPDRLIAGLVAHVDLADAAHRDEALDAHRLASSGLLRGIRDAAACDPNPEDLSIPGGAAQGRYGDPAFRAGVALLGRQSLTYDAWHFHHQNAEFAALARAVPETTLVLDHFGTPLGVGRYQARRDEIFDQWKLDIAEIAACENVVAKIGGLAMPDNGYRFHRAARPPTSDELVELQGRYYEHAIACFGPDRCMFESNFPVDRLSISYRVLWNAFKKIAAPYSPSERDDLFFGTAARTYSL